MKPIDESVRQELLADHTEVSRKIQSILQHKTNRTVEEENYLSPLISNEELLIEAPAGEYYYYTCIRRALEFALTKGRIPAGTALPDNSPKYLTDLLEKA